MKKYQVLKVENGNVSYIADIIEAENETQAIQKYINRIISYWGYCVFSKNDFVANVI